MYIRFIVDPFIPHGIQKVIRRVIKDLRNILADVTYSVEVDESLDVLLKREPVPVSKFFQRKLPMVCRGITIYIVNTNLTWKREEVFGLSSPTKCVVGIKSCPRVNYKMWSAKIWDLILHELGHSFGLIEESRAKSKSYISDCGTKHCRNNCVMSAEHHDMIWGIRAKNRYKRYAPFCETCRKYLLSKDI